MALQDALGGKDISVLQTSGSQISGSLTDAPVSKEISSQKTNAPVTKAASGSQTNAPATKDTSGQQTNPPQTPAPLTFVFSKKSIDARHGKVKLVMRYDVYIGEKAPSAEDLLPQWKSVKGKDCKTVLVVGSGPAGLFGALKLLEGGVKPIIIERGSDTKSRKVDIAKISTKGLLDSDSNYCFGEGGAGTFSDGKLFTRSNKRGNVGQVLRIFNHFGADPSILTDAHPHIGTDKLPYIINAMRAKIIELGGEFHFNTRCTGFITNGKNSVDGIKTLNTKSGEEKDFLADSVLLATGHSAGDIYELLAKTAPQSLEAKTFAAGVRIEHKRQTIDSIQFHGRKMPNAAEYSLTSQQTDGSKPYSKEDERGVYTFCMCPGGFVVPSATESGTIVVNGMSAAKRNSQWSNSAVVVETRPEDIPEKFKEMAKKNGCPALAGLYFRSSIEREAFLQANTSGKENPSTNEESMAGQKAPAQLLTDFLSHKKSPQEKLPKTSYFPGITSSRLDQWLPDQIARRMEKAFKEFNKKMKGFICDEALLIAPETRTSTPVRILRDRESYECCALKKLYPAGEGSGYSGGIVSSAMDGINACKKILERL
ncbi:MAG: FAD-dependent monooxygenase [Treponema sp.]|nr:FAD-dependent monooxygenase [Treponema sp.]